jgi:hypothetical protein
MEAPGRVKTAEGTIPRWEIRCTYVEACNCDYGCPCNFSGFPTYGHCRALVLYRIEQGHYGPTSLDGLSFVYAAAWPGAIHQGDGTLQLFVSEEATPDQRQAVSTIATGQARGTGHFAIFAPTFRYIHPPQFVDLQVTTRRTKSRFVVPGLLEVELEPFTNPVTGEEHEAEVHLPKGFIWRTARAARTRVMRIVSPHLTYDDSGQNAFFCQALSFEGP